MATDNHTQSLFWSFITLYKRLKGESLSYIRLVEEPTYLHTALDSARESHHQELASLALLLEQQVASVSKQTASAEAKHSGGNKPADNGPSEQQKLAETEYLSRLKVVLLDGPLLFEQRRELDRYCQTHRIHWQVAQRCEVALRRELRLPMTNWSEELLKSVSHFRDSEAGMSERDRLRLFDTYIKRGRLSMSHAEQILDEAEQLLKRVKPEVTSSQRGLKLTLSTAAVLALTLIFGLPWLRPAALGDGVRDVTAEQATGPMRVQVSGTILEDTVWRANTTYYLDDIVFVEGNARLTIEPGTTIRGTFGSALIITRDATLYARGTRDAPIVFTSARPEGERSRGDWGGLVLLGNAPINRTTGHIEGVDQLDVRGSFGGGDMASNCGTLEYLRVEFAGHEVFANNELNGLTFGGCGNTTIVRNVQVHMSLDDGIEVFGGGVDMSRILITGAKDDSLDWDMGWRGRVQFLIAQQYADAGDNAIEADNAKSDPDIQPRSAPTLYNVTLIGARTSDLGQRAMTLRRGTGGIFRNLLITGFPLEAVDIRDAQTAALTQTGELSFSHSLLHDIGPTGNQFFHREEGEEDDDAGFDELAWFSQPARNITMGASPQLTARASDREAPFFIPLSRPDGDLPVAPIPQDEFWDQGANYLGAIRPGIPSSWVEGWTNFAQK